MTANPDEQDTTKAATPPARARPLPLRLRIEHHDNEEYAGHTRRLLEKGLMPPVLYDAFRLVSRDDSPAAARVISYITHILDRLSHATTGKPSPPMNIFLSDQRGDHTGIITALNPPVLIVGLDLIDRIIESGLHEDHIAAVLGHERLHLLRHMKWDGLDNGRPEESIGDIFGVIESARAGYNPRALGNLFRLEKEHGSNQNRTLTRAVLNVLDEHPDIDDRIRNTELAIAHLQLTKRLNEVETPIPADVIDAVKSITYKTAYDRHKDAAGFDLKDPVQKLHSIEEYMTGEMSKREGKKIRSRYNEKTREWHYDLEPYADPILISMRIVMTLDDMQDLHLQPGIDMAAREAMVRHMRGYDGDPYSDLRDPYTAIMHQLALLTQETPVTLTEQFLDYNHQFRIDSNNEHIRTLICQSLPDKFHAPRQTATSFWGAQTPEDALTAANQYWQLQDELNEYQYGISAFNICPSPPAWPQRAQIREALSAGQKFRLPWENHVQWILHTIPDGSDNALLRRTMQELGCDDPRLTGRDIPEYRAGSSYNGQNIDFSHFHFDDDGNIVAMDQNEGEKMAAYRERMSQPTIAALYDNEYRLEYLREENERSILKKTDWTLMEKDFWAFAAAHQEYLEPVHTVVPARYPFAAALMHRLDALAHKNPGTWGVTRDTFLTGFAPDKDKRNTADFDGKIRKFSIPWLIHQSEKRYFGHATYYDDFWRSVRQERGALPDDHPLTDLLAAQINEPGLENRKKRRRNQHVKADYLTISLAIDEKHPFARAIMDYRGTLIKPAEKANLLSHFRFYDNMTESEDAFFRIDPKKAFNQGAIRGIRGIHAFINKVEDHATNRSPSYYWRKFISLSFLKLLRRADAGTYRGYMPIATLNRHIVTESFSFIYNTDLSRKLSAEQKNRINNQLLRNFAIDTKPVTPFPVLMRRFLDYHGFDDDDRFLSSPHNIFATRPRLQESYLLHIRARIMALPVEKRIHPLSRLMRIQLKDPSYRDWAIDTWINATLAMYGKDNGDKRYARKIMELINKVVWNFDSTNAAACVTGLLDKIEAQRDISLKAKQFLFDRFGHKFFEADMATRMAESLIGICAHNPALRQAFLDFITEPLTEKSAKNFVRTLRNSNAGEDSEKNILKNFFSKKSDARISPAEEVKAVGYMYKNFWNTAFEIRTVYLDRILFPVDDKDGNFFKHAVDFVLEKVLPSDAKFSAEAREILQVYLDCCPQELRRTTFSAILATAERRDNSEPARPGQILSLVLTRTGAAGGQILQAVHSYLSGIVLTDPDMIHFRDDLKSSKVNFSRPMRWEMFERMDEVLPPDMLKAIRKDHIGPILGCGSTAYVVARSGESGESAIKLMRKDVASIADLQFERFYNAAKMLAGRRDIFRALPEMIAHASGLMPIATNGHIAGRQIDYARATYGPLRVRVDGIWHNFDVAPVIAAGDEYIETARIHGKHLNDLESGPAKARYARAIETVELYRQLRGIATDKDRHGGQQGLLDGHIGIFDVGQLPYDLERNSVHVPDTAEKRAFGRVLGMVFNAVADGHTPVAALIDATTRHDWGAAHDFIVGEQRALLARQDVHNGLAADAAGRESALRAIFGAVWKTGRVDPAIAHGLAETLNFRALANIARSSLRAGNVPDAGDLVIEDAAAPETPPITLPYMAGLFVAYGLKQRLGS